MLNIHEVWENDDICSIVSEFLPGGDLLRYCNQRQLPLPEKDVNVIMKQLLRALVYLHRQNVVHADIKLENCLFGSDDQDSLVLVDFGLSFNIKQLSEVTDGMRGTLNYMAPEILLADQGRPIMP